MRPIGKFIPQCKGTDVNRLSIKNRLQADTPVYWSKKIDGRYIQIHCGHTPYDYRFFTSSGKEFHIQEWVDTLLGLSFVDIVLEAEYIQLTDGKVGSLPNTARLTTYISDFKVGRKSTPLKGESFVVFQVIPSKDGLMTETGYDLSVINSICNITGNDLVKCVKHKLTTYGDVVNDILPKLLDDGWEGVVVYTQRCTYRHTERSNIKTQLKVKLKLDGEVELECIGTTAGTAGFTGLIGSLVLDTKGTTAGTTVSVSSGLTIQDREIDPSYYIGRMVSIKYFNILNTYTQPRVISINNHKDI